MVAKVGREKITLKEFKDNFAQRFRGEENAARRSYQDREKLIQEMALDLAKFQDGIARGIDKRPEVAEQINQVASRKALDLLYQNKVIDAVINDQTAKAFYDKSGEELRARHILLKTSPVDSAQTDTVRVRARMDSIKRAIATGLDFKAAAARFSEDATSAADSGELGWFGWGRMVGAFQDAAWAGKAGEIVGPVRTDYGYHLILVEEKRPVKDRPDYANSKDAIKNQLRDVESQKLMETARAYVESLRTRAKVNYNQANLETFRKRLQDPTVSKSQPLEALFTEEQKKLEAASYKGGTVSVADLIAKVGPNAQRVNWNDAQSTTDLVNAIVEPKLLETDAEKQGFVKQAQKDPDVVREKRQAVVRLLEKEEVTDKVNPTPEDERRFYESHLADFIQPETRTIREIFIKDDSAKAAQVRAQALKGADFRKLTVRYNEKESTKADTGRLGPFDEKRFGLIGKTAFSLVSPGEVSAVLSVGKNFSVIQLLEVVPSRTKSFEESAVEAKRLTRQFQTDERQKALEKEMLAKYKLDVDSKVLASAWPLPEGTPQDKLSREP